MPAVTYLSDGEVKAARSVEDKGLNDALQELRKVTGEEWLIRSAKVYEEKRWFKKQKSTISYRLFVHIGSGEYQIINLAGVMFVSSFEDYKNSRNNVLNFILGYLCCHDNQKRHVKK